MGVQYDGEDEKTAREMTGEIDSEKPNGLEAQFTGVNPNDAQNATEEAENEGIDD